MLKNTCAHASTKREPCQSTFATLSHSTLTVRSCSICFLSASAVSPDPGPVFHLPFTESQALAFDSSSAPDALLGGHPRAWTFGRPGRWILALTTRGGGLKASGVDTISTPSLPSFQSTSRSMVREGHSHLAQHGGHHLTVSTSLLLRLSLVRQSCQF